MADANFAVVFRGRLVEGAEPAAVRANLATLFKADAARIEKMFSGQTVIIKKGLDEAGAKKYLAVLAKAGALAEMARTTPKAAEPAASAATPATPATAAPVASAAAPARPLAATAPPQTIPSAYADGSPPAAIEASVDEPGVVLVDYQAPAAPDIATEHLSMAEPGVTLVEAGHVPEPEYDLSALTLDPPGTTLVEAAHVEPPEYEFEGLSVADNA